MADDPDVPAVDLVAAFTRLQSLTLSTPRVSDFLSDLVAWAPQLAGSPLSAGITARGEGEPYTVTSSDNLAISADRLQYARGDGPCLDALRTGQQFYVEDMRDETRWNDYPQHAAQAAGALAMVLRHARQDELSAQLEQALSSRAVIDQAIGIPAIRSGIEKHPPPVPA